MSANVSNQSREVTAPGSSDELFTRKASGLIRSMNVRTLFGFAIGAMLATYLFFPASTAPGTFPGGDIAVPFLIGGIVALIVILPYIQLVSAMPRSGGDYVFASRVFTPIVGAFAGSLVLGSLLLLNAFDANFLTTSWIPISLQTLGMSFAHHTFDSWAASIPAHHWTTFIIEFVFLLCVLGAAMLPTKRVLAIIFGAFMLNILGGLVILFEFLVHSHSDFQHAFNHYSGSPAAYSSIVAGAKQAGVVTHTSASAVIKCIPLGIFSFTGLTFTVYNAGEIKQASKTFRNGTLAAVIAITAFLLIEYFALRHFASYRFIASATGLNDANPGKYGKITTAPAISGGMLYGAMTANVVFRIIMALAWVSGVFAAVLTPFFACSRLLFAFSFDRLLPSKLSDVNQRLASPINALLVVFVVSVALTVVNTFSTSFVTLSSNILLLFLIFWGISAAATAILPWRRPELFNASPKVVPGKIAGIPVISIVSALTVVLMAVLFYITATNKSLSGGFSTVSVIELVVIALFGPVAYLLAKAGLRRRQGIDLSLAVQELPPE